MEPKNQDKFLYTLASILIILYLFTGVVWLLYLALAFHFTELLFEKTASRVNRWLSVGFTYIGKFNGRVLLTLVYYLVLTPLSFIARAFGQLGYDAGDKRQDSQFKSRNHTYDPADLEEMW